MREPGFTGWRPGDTLAKVSFDFCADPHRSLAPYRGSAIRRGRCRFRAHGDQRLDVVGHLTPPQPRLLSRLVGMRRAEPEKLRFGGEIGLVGAKVDGHRNMLMDNKPPAPDLLINVGHPHCEIELLPFLVGAGQRTYRRYG